MPQQSRLSTFLAELKRRRVFRVAAVYGGVSFVLVQIIDGTFEVMGIPAWVSRLAIILLALGFPLAVGLAWVFDITSEGIVRTDRVSTDSGPKGKVQPSSGKPLTSNRALIVVALLAVAFGLWSRWGGGEATTGQIRSIAVLPLENQMGDPDQEYFVEGMHDLLITELSRLQGLRVISRNSAAYYRGSTKRTEEIAAELQVDAIVEGSVFRGGNQVRINAQLIGMHPERHLWTAVYERDLINILAMQREIAQTIAAEIGLSLGGPAAAGPAPAKTVNPSSYDAYARGRQLWQKRTGPDIMEAIGFFQHAIDLDSTNALAWGGLADAYAITSYYANWPVDSSRALARTAALRALELEPNLAQPHTTLGFLAPDFATREEHFEQALNLDPNYATSYHWYGMALREVGQVEAAAGLFDQGARLDPYSLPIRGNQVEVYYFRGEFEQYAQAARKAIADYGPLAGYRLYLADALLMLGQLDSALAILRVLDQEKWTYAKEKLAFAYAERGDREIAEAYLRDATRNDPLQRPAIYAIFHAQQGELDQAFDSLEQYMRINDPMFALGVRVDPRAGPLVEDPRFDALLKKYGVTN